jgi:hypothetical protein
VAAAVAGSLCLVLALPITQAPAAVKQGRIGIGDSVMQGARNELRKRGFGRVDTSISRQFYLADDRILYWKAQGKLPRNVVIHLGNNGTVVSSDCNKAVKAAGSGRMVFLVTLKVPRSWRAPNNRRLLRCANRFANARLIDWYTYSRNQPSWFSADGYHLTVTGRRKYAAFIASKVTAG